MGGIIFMIMDSGLSFYCVSCVGGGKNALVCPQAIFLFL